MDVLERHETFEIEVLENLKNGRFLEPLVFGGGTMLRLCHELNRYSADLDFWFVKDTDTESYFAGLKKYLERSYELTDSEVKFHTLLFEIRSKDYPRRLKIEIRREAKECDFQDRIAFSPFTTRQVVLRTHTLQQTMKNKVQAALERKAIRDLFDIEFLLRRGIPMPELEDSMQALKEVAGSFGRRDFQVTLGSMIGTEPRAYYVDNGFSYLIEKIP